LGMNYPATAPIEEVAHYRKMFWYLVIGTIPAGVAGLLFHHEIEEKLRQPTIIGISVVLIALLMWWADSKKDLTRKEGESTLGDALVIATAQALALWPGGARSGITISPARARRAHTAAATRFSFILSVPALTAAV